MWSAHSFELDEQGYRIFLFDPTTKMWPGSQPQTIVVTDEDFRLRYWTEVGGEPMFHSAKLETTNGKVVLAITCQHRRRLRPNNIGIYRYRLSPSGLQMIGAVEWTY